MISLLQSSGPISSVPVILTVSVSFLNSIAPWLIEEALEGFAI